MVLLFDNFLVFIFIVRLVPIFINIDVASCSLCSYNVC